MISPRTASGVLLLFGVAILLLASARVSGAPKAQSTYQLVRQGMAYAQSGNCQTGLALLSRAVKQKRFAALPRVMRRDAVRDLLRCADQTGDWSTGLAFLIDLIEDNGASPVLAYKLYIAGLDQADAAAVVSALEWMAEYSPETISDLHSRAVFEGLRIVREFDAEDAMTGRFLRAVHGAGYTPYNTVAPQDYLKLAYLRILVKQDDIEMVRTIVPTITDPEILLRIRIDKQFDKARTDSSIERLLDLRAAVDRYVQIMRAKVARYPTTIEAHILYQRALMAAWRFDDALQAVEQIVSDIERGDAKNSYSDFDEQANWLLNNYARNLQYLGKRAEAARVFERSMEYDEQGFLNVSQRINFARSLLGQRQFRKAYELAREVTARDASTYGMMWARSTEVCALKLMDEARDYTPSLSYMILNAAENADAMIKAYLCIEEEDRAAEIVIRSLQNPERQIDMLMNLQIPRRNPGLDMADKDTVIEELNTTFRKLAEREDVAAAIASVGRVEEVWIHQSGW